MSLLVAIQNRNVDKLVGGLKERLGAEQVKCYEQGISLDDVNMVLGWNVPTGLYAKLPNLKAVSSFGAGVDGVNLQEIPSQLQVARIVDNELASDMAEYVLTQVLLHKTNMPRYIQAQQEQLWRPKRVKSGVHVALLGYGQLGKAIATKLTAAGFKVSAWSNSEKHDAEVTHFHGEQGLAELLPQADYLVCVLPLTQHTHQIINAQLLAQLPEHAVVINVGRGQHLDEAALIQAIEQQKLAGASLDVMTQEPLAADSVLWQLPNVIITPHCSALSRLETVVEQVATNYQLLQQGKQLVHCIDRTRDY